MYRNVLLILIFMGLINFKLNAEDGKNKIEVNLKRKFAHTAHKKAFLQNGITCLDCHLTNITKINNEKEYEDLNKNINNFRKKTCHACHNNPEKGIKAPNRCVICHGNATNIKPANHTMANWKGNHELDAKIRAQECSKCHLSSFCIECHKSKIDLKRKVHGGSFLYTHSIMARATPQKCSHCHQVSYCMNCHSRRGN